MRAGQARVRSTVSRNTPNPKNVQCSRPNWIKPWEHIWLYDMICIIYIYECYSMCTLQFFAGPPNKDGWTVENSINDTPGWYSQTGRGEVLWRAPTQDVPLLNPHINSVFFSQPDHYVSFFSTGWLQHVRIRGIILRSSYFEIMWWNWSSSEPDRWLPKIQFCLDFYPETICQLPGLFQHSIFWTGKTHVSFVVKIVICGSTANFRGNILVHLYRHYMDANLLGQPTSEGACIWVFPLKLVIFGHLLLLGKAVVCHTWHPHCIQYPWYACCIPISSRLP